MDTNNYAQEYDKDGLLFSDYMRIEGGRIFHGGKEVFVAPECRGCIDFLLEDISLWSVSRIRVNLTDIRMKRAPIIGVPFGQALIKAIQLRGTLQKSLFQVAGWTEYQGKAVIATMLAHTSASLSGVEFQAWQFLDVSDETFYIHARISHDLSIVSHLDVATMTHTKQERDEIFAHTSKIKGQHYTKHFRLDGEVSISSAEKLMDLYFPVQELTKEFLHVVK